MRKLSPWRERFVYCLHLVLRPFQRTQLYSQQENLFQAPGSVPFPYAVGVEGQCMSSHKLIDSGLLLLSTWEPLQHGFRAFEHQSTVVPSWHEEQLANKGMLYAYWRKDESSQVGSLVINTHLTTECEHKRYMELKELKQYIRELRETFIGKTRYLEVYAVGDFNIECDNAYLIEVMVNELGFELVTDFVEGELQGNIDHIFRWNNFKEEDGDDAGTVQQTIDPPMLTRGTSLSDHAWRGILNRT